MNQPQQFDNHETSEETQIDRRFYGRRKGRPMNTGRTNAVENVLPRVRVPATDVIDPAILMPGMKAYRLEIGFGTGEHLIAEAAANPEVGFIGAEPFINGYAAMLLKMEQQGLTNIRLWPDDMRPMLAAFAPASLEMIYLLFSDPWPKKRHTERRVLQSEALDGFARALAPGGILRIATDDPGLQEWTAEQMAARADFTPAPGLHGSRPAWPNTRYEQKAVAAGRTCMYWEFKKI